MSTTDPKKADIVDRLIESEKAADKAIVALMKRIEELTVQKSRLREMLKECEDCTHGDLNQRIQLAVKETE